MKINKIYGILTLVITLFTSCQNQDVDFPDHDYQTVYFANQYYVRTIELGEDITVDTSIDNQHKMKINATMGGVFKNTTNRIIDFKVEESLCNNLYFSGGARNGVPILPMPATHYTLAANQIVIPSGRIQGGVEVQLTAAFFEDPKTLEANYVIPLLMTNVQGADSILQGSPQISNPDRCISSDWNVLPKDFVLCAVKYVNPWHADYLRRGIDQITGVEGTTTVVRRQQYVEKDQVVNITTNSLTKATLPLIIKDSKGNNVPFNVRMEFAQDGTCLVSASDEAYEITGTGKFVTKGEKNSMGGIDRDALYLDYQVDFKNLNVRYATKDTLVVRNRGIKSEYFAVVKQ